MNEERERLLMRRYEFEEKYCRQQMPLKSELYGLSERERESLRVSLL